VAICAVPFCISLKKYGLFSILSAVCDICIMDMIVPLCLGRNLEETAGIENRFPDGSAIVDTEMEDNTIA
jgi:hypothetical protein